MNAAAPAGSLEVRGRLVEALGGPPADPVARDALRLLGQLDPRADLRRGPLLDGRLARHAEAERLLRPPRALEPDGPAGVLHAKAVVADEAAVFLTSANLTEAALDRNIEMGLLVRDRALAASVTRHFQVLIERGLLSPLPAS